MATTRPDVLISSSVADLGEYRAAAIDVVTRLGLNALAMEYLTAETNDALAVSERLARQADVYVGLFGKRYGSLDRQGLMSFTEAEYRVCAERDVPRLIFRIGDDRLVASNHPERAAELMTFLDAEHVTKEVCTPGDLRFELAMALHKLPTLTSTSTWNVTGPQRRGAVTIGHAYPLMSDRELVGRSSELLHLDEWLSSGTLNVPPSGQAEPDEIRVLQLVGPGGSGKSALAWRWFERVTTRQPAPERAIWWSFYEESSTFLDFARELVRTLTGYAPDPRENSASLMSTVRSWASRHQVLVVLDGFERLLAQYSDVAAVHTATDADGSSSGAFVVMGGESTAEPVAARERTPASSRSLIDPTVRSFLRVMLDLVGTRTLITTRVPCADLEDRDSRRNRAHVGVHELPHLGAADCREIWRSEGLDEPDDRFDALAEAVGYHPLTIRLTAARVRNDRQHPGLSGPWLDANFRSGRLTDETVLDKIEELVASAVRDLPAGPAHVLRTMAAFRGSISYDDLVLQHVDDDDDVRSIGTLLADLETLEDRRLIGWTRSANEYDMHPTIRALTWTAMSSDERYEAAGLARRVVAPHVTLRIHTVRTAGASFAATRDLIFQLTETGAATAAAAFVIETCLRHLNRTHECRGLLEHCERALVESPDDQDDEEGDEAADALALVRSLLIVLDGITADGASLRAHLAQWGHLTSPTLAEALSAAEFNIALSEGDVTTAKRISSDLVAQLERRLDTIDDDELIGTGLAGRMLLTLESQGAIVDLLLGRPAAAERVVARTKAMSQRFDLLRLPEATGVAGMIARLQRAQGGVFRALARSQLPKVYSIADHGIASLCFLGATPNVSAEQIDWMHRVTQSLATSPPLASCWMVLSRAVLASEDLTTAAVMFEHAEAILDDHPRWVLLRADLELLRFDLQVRTNGTASHGALDVAEHAAHSLSEGTYAWALNGASLRRMWCAAEDAAGAG